MQIDRTRILILNFNGKPLLAECLPSVVAAAQAAPIPCPVMVIDNGSGDDSVDYLRSHWPNVEIASCANRGLASFNDVLAYSTEPVVLLLNNDVKLAAGAVAPLLRAIESHPEALFAAPQCWSFDGIHYEGMRTRVRSRFGLVRGLCRIPGHEALVDTPDLTASAGPILAVDRRKFLELGGFDPIYFPGRIEDLDLGFRCWMRGWRGYYVPESLAYHRGQGSFGPKFGQAGCDRLAFRNTLIFAWKNLAGPRLWMHLAWLPIRMGAAVLRGRFGQLRAAFEALVRLRAVIESRRGQGVGGRDWVARQEAFFERLAY